MSNRSAEKRERQNAVRRMRNRQNKSAVRTACKKFEAAVAAENKEEAAQRLATAERELDHAASKGVIPKNTASRKKSRLHRRYNKMIQA